MTPSLRPTGPEIRNTVRREDVEITEEPGVEQATGATAGEPTMSNEPKPRPINLTARGVASLGRPYSGDRHDR
jgi:hypothetical protein